MRPEQTRSWMSLNLRLFPRSPPPAIARVHCYLHVRLSRHAVTEIFIEMCGRLDRSLCVNNLLAATLKTWSHALCIPRSRGLLFFSHRGRPPKVTARPLAISPACVRVALVMTASRRFFRAVQGGDLVDRTSQSTLSFRLSPAGIQCFPEDDRNTMLPVGAGAYKDLQCTHTRILRRRSVPYGFQRVVATRWTSFLG